MKKIFIFLVLMSTAFITFSSVIKGPVLREGEQIVKKKGANHLLNGVFDGGRLFLTNQRLIFKTTALNFNKYEISFELDEIDSAVKSKLFNGMIVILKSGEERPFVIWGRKKWINLINESKK